MLKYLGVQPEELERERDKEGVSMKCQAVSHHCCWRVLLEPTAQRSLGKDSGLHQSQQEGPPTRGASVLTFAYL